MKAETAAGGKFYGVGVGPGDPELMTLKACRILGEVDVVCCPRPDRDKEGLALSIARGSMRRDSELLELHLPMTRDRGELEHCWREAAEAIHRRLAAGKKVAFITLGDPGFYSTYGYILAELKRRDPALAVETVPGVTSLSACSAALNLVVAEGEEKLAIVPGGDDAEGLAGIMGSFENVVVMKASRDWEATRRALDRAGMAGRAVLATRCGLAKESFHRQPESLPAEKVDYISLLLMKRKGLGI